MEFVSTALFVILVIAVSLIASVRVLREDQRATAWLPGRTLVVKGPGLVLRIPRLHQRWQKHSIGNRGVLLANGRVLLNGVNLPVELQGRKRASRGSSTPVKVPRWQRELAIPGRTLG